MRRGKGRQGLGERGWGPDQVGPLRLPVVPLQKCDAYPMSNIFLPDSDLCAILREKKIFIEAHNYVFRDRIVLTILSLSLGIPQGPIDRVRRAGCLTLGTRSIGPCEGSFV